jgi:glycosyltransferase involved in cell wall biosynthesis
MKSKISVIIPTFNFPESLKKTVESLKEQTFKDFEILIVDDYSPEKPPEDLRVIRNERSKGPAGARNTGIIKAKAEILAFTDSDCIVDVDWLKNIYDNIGEEVMVGSAKIPLSTFLGNSISALGYPAGANLGFRNVWRINKGGYTDSISGCNFAIKKFIFEKYGMFDESFPIASAEEAELSHRLLKNGVRIKYFDDLIVYHEPRKNLKSFIKWHIYRGRGNYYFHKKIGNVNKYLLLKLRYVYKVIRVNLFKPKIVLVVPLLLTSFFCQQIGYIKEKMKNDT